jgi:V8-like Glu-specific endopeptidase
MRKYSLNNLLSHLCAEDSQVTSTNNERGPVSGIQDTEKKRLPGWGFRAPVAGVSALCLMMPLGLYAQRNGVSLNTVRVQTNEAAQVQSYWTSERLAHAKTVQLTPQIGVNDFPLSAGQPQNTNEPAVRGGGSTPTLRADPLMRQVLVQPSDLAAAADELAQQVPFDRITPDATSSFGAYFTTSRVFPDATTTAYPYSLAGKLYFTDPKTGGNFVCSASVLRPRIIVTAGHCVTSPSTDPKQRHFYSNFLFVPAYNNGAAPFGVWTPSLIGVTNEWYFSNGSVPNAQDVGMLVAVDHRGVKLGQYTGWLGFFTNQLSKNHVTMLGYPCNLDSCSKMQESFAQTFESGGNNTYIYGSAMRGGASGGPWIQDFGIAPAGAPGGVLANNYLVAVTSYGPIATSPMYLGASNLDSRFLNLLTTVCGSANSGNCQ